MKTTYVVALIAAISAVSIGAISMNDFTIPLATASASPESSAIMGHVEYVLRDTDGNIKSYVQADNIVVDRGDSCVIGYAFQPTTASGGADTCANAGRPGFHFIGIANGTTTVTPTSTWTTVNNTSTVVASSGVSGLMAVKYDNNTVATAITEASTVVISTESPFAFDANNATTVRVAGLFDGSCNGVDTATGACTTNTGVMNMFSAQSITVAVSSGDSLSVTWTITVGNAS